MANGLAPNESGYNSRCYARQSLAVAEGHAAKLAPMHQEKFCIARHI